MSALSEDLRQKILAYLPRYPSKQAVTLPALHLVHDQMRYVSLEAIREIADLLDLSPAELYDAMSFYGFFLACMLRGSEEVLDRLCDTLGVQPGGTTTDGKITLEFAECLGGCEGAPCLLINDEQRMNVTAENVDALIEELRQ
ncbi:MAG: NAD(P)H-dependent oxidoreductase subunit E [Planctomycetota bacterium]|nr:MAG: NAD(P)H-dependent oxidoreductase subunit E [Planctomycetota bacterium]